MSRRRPAILPLLFVLCACSSRSQPATMPAIADRDWELVTLGDRSDPLGAEGRRVTQRLEAAGRRATDSSLTLSGPGGALARFVAAPR